MRKQVDLEIIAREFDRKILEAKDFKSDPYIGHFASVFDHNHPVNNFLYEMGIQDSERLHQLVAEGAEIVPDKDRQELAARYIEDWVQLISDVKAGKEAEPMECIFGKIKPKYDPERLNDSDKMERFKGQLKTICAIAKYDLDQTLQRMLG